MSIPIVAALVAIAAAVALALGIFLDRILLRRFAHNELTQSQEIARKLIADAEEEAKTIRHERIFKVEEELHKKEQDLERSFEEQRRAQRQHQEKIEDKTARLNRRTQRVNEREALLQKATETIDALKTTVEAAHKRSHKISDELDRVLETSRDREALVQSRESELDEARKGVDDERERVAQMSEEHLRILEHAAGLSRTEAKESLVSRLVDQAELESASTIKEIRDEARLKANREARRIVLAAIQRTAAGHAIENAVSVVNIQSDEMKGRIIGREGRNIRAFEAATGIEVIVDDTPEAVILSGFNPVRREIARIALSRLIQDGRIHPARIEEVVEKTAQEIDEEIIENGERTIIDLDIHGLHPELIRHIGRMRYRTSYGQNLLSHSIETARIASMMAAELGIDAARSRRAGLLHDIGKVVEEDIQQPHALVGMDLCRKYGERDDVCNAVGAHHDEIEMTSLISPLVQAADAISGARPGARREALESYIRRLERLEEVAGSFEGVDRVFAIQAGREVRVIVNHELVSDQGAQKLATDISGKIQYELQYPGQIKVTVIREVRSVAVAK